jgi:hypothetical protein
VLASFLINTWVGAVLRAEKNSTPLEEFEEIAFEKLLTLSPNPPRNERLRLDPREDISLDGTTLRYHPGKMLDECHHVKPVHTLKSGGKNKGGGPASAVLQLSPYGSCRAMLAHDRGAGGDPSSGGGGRWAYCGTPIAHCPAARPIGRFVKMSPPRLLAASVILGWWASSDRPLDAGWVPGCAVRDQIIAKSR